MLHTGKDELCIFEISGLEGGAFRTSRGLGDICIAPHGRCIVVGNVRGSGAEAVVGSGTEAVVPLRFHRLAVVVVLLYVKWLLAVEPLVEVVQGLWLEKACLEALTYLHESVELIDVDEVRLAMEVGRSMDLVFSGATEMSASAAEASHRLHVGAEAVLTGHVSVVEAWAETAHPYSEQLGQAQSCTI